MAVTVDQLQVKITSDSTEAVKALKNLRTSLDKLKTLVKSTSGLDQVSARIERLASAANSIHSTAATNLSTLADALSKLANVPKLQIGATTANQITRLGDAVEKLVYVPTTGVTSLIQSLKAFETLGQTNLGSLLKELNKIPKLAEKFKTMEFDTFAKQIERLAAAMKPLADEMDKVAKGFSAMPSKIINLIRSGEKLAASNQKTATSFKDVMNSMGLTALKTSAIVYAYNRLVEYASAWVNESNDYVENLNLFNVAMGEYADSAMAYAERVQDVLGIDPSEFIRNWGIFKQITTGFGVVEEKAQLMSKNLTQIGYDISSFYNISIEDAMQKVQSGISGELEPLRRLGYALDVATLQQIAYTHGIEENINTMTQAQKSQLRYLAIMEQSTNVMGDMGRTIMSPANAMRVLDQQITQLSRALGNVLIPLMMTLIPYVQAAVEVLTEFAQALALSLGFELPEIDYSNLGGLSSVTDTAEDAAGALDDATEAAKKLKTTTLGIDELNILSPDTGDSGAGAGDVGVSGGGYDLPIELPEYEFLSGYGKNLDEIKEKMRDILDVALKVGKVLAALWAVKKLIDFAKKVGLATQALIEFLNQTKFVKGMFDAFDAFTDAFFAALDSGDNLWRALNSGLDAFREMIPLWLRIALGAAAAAVEFIRVKNAVYDLTMGNRSLGEALADIILTTTLVSAAMYALFGPIGVLAGLLAGLVGAAVGYAQAQSDLRVELANRVVFDGMGESLSGIADAFTDLTDKVIERTSVITDMATALDSSRDSAIKAASELEVLSATMGTVGPATQEEVDKALEAFGRLYEGIYSNMTQSQAIIQTALVDALKNATPEVSEQIDLLIGEYQRYVRDTQGRAEELRLLIEQGYQDLYGKAADSPEYMTIMQNINNWLNELGALSGGMSDAAWEWEQLVKTSQEEGIDLGSSVEEANASIEQIATAGSDALAALGEAKAAALKEVDQQIKYAAQYMPAEDLQLLYDIRQKIADDYAAQEDGIKSQIEAVFSDISSQIGDKAEDVYNEALAAYDDLNWFEKIWNGDKFDYAKATVSAFETEIQNPILNSINAAAKDLNLDSAKIGTNMVQGITNGIKNQWEIAKPEEMMTQNGRHVIDGFNNGMEEKLPEVYDGSAKIGEETIRAMTDKLDIHSPSKVMEGFGQNVDEGFVKGLESKSKNVYNAMVSVLNPLLYLIEQFVGRAQDAVSSMLSSIAESIASAQVNESGGVDFDSPRAITVPRFASGGFVDRGEMFIARESGPELVGTIGSRTAVANNDQIVESLQGGVEAGNMPLLAAIYQLIAVAEQIADKETTIELDGEAIARSTRSYNAKRGYNLGLTST